VDRSTRSAASFVDVVIEDCLKEHFSGLLNSLIF
jgi:hypothetical protein